MFVITIDGVLRGTENQPIPAGRSLYGSLNAFSPVILLGNKLDFDEYWIKMNLKDTPAALYGLDTSTPNRLSQVLAIRNAGYRVDAVIDSDPSLVAELLSKGFTSLTFMSPAFTSPSLRPDKGEISPWAELITTVEADQQLKANVKYNLDAEESDE